MTGNASAGAYAWLSESLDAADPGLWDGWWELPGERLGESADTIIWTEPWPHDYWVAQCVWLGRPLDPLQLREAVQVVAGLLVSPPLLEVLLAAARHPGAPAVLGMCALRRWAIGLRALAWLEEAIDHPWKDVRLVDVVGFAYASIAPWWPRPSLAVSHRSGDAKPELMSLDLWGTPHVAIDSTTVPIRDSNTGFVWRLFAATPTVVRVRSENYDASTWCRREAELTQYLLEESDFMRGRVVADAGVAGLVPIDRALASLSPPPEPDGPGPPGEETSFPPRTREACGGSRVARRERRGRPPLARSRPQGNGMQRDRRAGGARVGPREPGLVRSRLWRTSSRRTRTSRRPSSTPTCSRSKPARTRRSSTPWASGKCRASAFPARRSRRRPPREPRALRPRRCR